MKNYREYHVARSKSGKLDSVSRHETQPAAERELAALAGAIRADGDDPSDLCVVGVWSKWDDAEVLSVVGELLDYGPNGCATTCDTIIPSAPPTETEHDVPAPDSEALHLGNFILPKSYPRAFGVVGQWARSVADKGWSGSATVQEGALFTVTLVHIDVFAREQVAVSVDRASLDIAWSVARERGCFPDEFFEALRAPL